MSTFTPSRYVVVGAGAVGATVAAQLSGVGIDVVVVARGANLEALRSHGLRYLRPAPGGPAPDGLALGGPALDGPTLDGLALGGPAPIGIDDRRIPLPVVGGPDEVKLREGDVLVLAVKSQDSEALLAQWAWQPVAVGAGTAVGTAVGTRAGSGVGAGNTGAAFRTAAEVVPVVLLQNGLDNARTALRRFATVIDAVVLVPSSHLRPGEVVSPGFPLAGAFHLGRAPHGTDPTVERVAAQLRLASFAVQVVPDVDRWKAGKLLGNLAYNLDVLYPPSELRDRAAAALVDEARAVFAAAGIQAVDVQSRSSLDLSGLVVHDLPGHSRQGSSTWQSLARGGSVESDFLHGEIVLLARLHGVEAPVSAGVQRRIATAALAGAAPGSLDSSDLAELLASARPPAGANAGVTAGLTAGADAGATSGATSGANAGVTAGAGAG